MNSFADFASKIGGIYELFMVFGGLVIGLLGDRLFIGFIINKIYQLDGTREKAYRSEKKRLQKEHTQTKRRKKL